MDSAVASERFEQGIAQFHQWREELTQSVHAYHDWLEANGHLDVQQSIRFYDLLENLNRGRLMLAFLAEFSRGKSELINALFFSDFKERLLPSDDFYPSLNADNVEVVIEGITEVRSRSIVTADGEERPVDTIVPALQRYAGNELPR